MGRPPDPARSEPDPRERVGGRESALSKQNTSVLGPAVSPESARWHLDTREERGPDYSDYCIRAPAETKHLKTSSSRVRLDDKVSRPIFVSKHL